MALGYLQQQNLTYSLSWVTCTVDRPPPIGSYLQQLTHSPPRHRGERRSESSAGPVRWCRASRALHSAGSREELPRGRGSSSRAATASDRASRDGGRRRDARRSSRGHAGGGQAGVELPDDGIARA